MPPVMEVSRNVCEPYYKHYITDDLVERLEKAKNITTESAF